jgi:endonuclease-8
MPEGDTIFRAARTLHKALAGRVVNRFESRFAVLERTAETKGLVGQNVVRVGSVGKHLLMEFSGGLVLRTHMRMNGSWHVYRPGERWRASPSSMSIVISTDEYVAVAFDVPVAEFLDAGELRRHRELRNLGPDLLAEEFDIEEAVSRLKALPDMQVGVALLNQRAMAGVGNVFKSETLFVAGIHPKRPVSSLSEEELRTLVSKARELLLANVRSPAPSTTFRGYRRTTGMVNPRAALWVYSRTGRPCRRCGSPIRCERQGEDARGTYWCERCQT